MAHYLFAKHTSFDKQRVLWKYVLFSEDKGSVLVELDKEEFSESLFKYFTSPQRTEVTNITKYLEKERTLFTRVDKKRLRIQKLVPLSLEERKGLEKRLSEFSP